MSGPNALPIAGWYPDPENDTSDRWWNGASWSDHRRPRNAAAGWAPAAKKTSATAKKQAAAAAVPVPTAPAAATAIPGIPVPTPAVNPYAANPGPYAPAYPYSYAPAQPTRNPLALAGMLTSLIGLLFNWILFGAPGIVGGILSIVGLTRANQLIREGVTVGNGKAMAITGIASGFAGALLFDLFFVVTTWSPLAFS